MKFAIVLGLFLHTYSHAALPVYTLPSYQLKMDLSINGKHVSTPQVVIESGHTASVVQKTAKGQEFIDVVATENPAKEHSGILMKFTIGSIDKTGKRTITHTPQIIAQDGKAASMSVQGADKESLNLSVVARRKSI